MLIGALALRIQDPLFLSEIRLRTFDIFQRFKPRTYVETPVRVIDIDNTTLQRFGQWPWPRSQVADLIGKLGAAGARAVALDIVFAEPDRTGPKAAAAGWGLADTDPLAQAITARVTDPDLVLVNAVKSTPTVLGFILLNEEGTAPMPRRKAGMAVTGAAAGRDPRNFVRRFNSAITSLQPFQIAAKGQGSINVFTEGDAIVRRLPLLLNGRDTLYPSLVADTLRVAQKASTIVVKSSGAAGYTAWWQRLTGSLVDIEGIAEVKIGALKPLTDEHGQVWLYDTGRIAARTIPAWRILEGEKVDLAGTILFIGTSAPGLLDLRATPTDAVTPGVEIHAQIAEQILTGVSLNRPYWTILPELGFLIVLGSAMIALLPRVGPLGCAFLGATAMLTAIGAAWYAFADRGQLFDPIYPSLAALLVFIIGAMSSYFRSDTERRSVRAAFSHYLSPQMVEQLAAEPERLRLGGELRPLTILFCDIRDFTSISERTSPQDLTLLLNRFLTPMTDAVLSHGGTIDKYIGDSIMAFWNAPLDDPHHARNACLAAIEMRRRLATLNGELEREAEVQRRHHEPLRMGIGINSGICLVGNLGSQQRFNYSAIGDEVNLASRMEGLSKNYGVDILIGWATQDLVPDFAVLPLGLAAVKGKAESSSVFALLADPDFNAGANANSVLQAFSQIVRAITDHDLAHALSLLNASRQDAIAAGLGPLIDHLDATLIRMEQRLKRTSAS
ncbi:MAG: adenylate/guanylate cyclase domain-containing protein [Proteobacteria bacterium]|nr:adenylate/guanylate cyclase domain-containing protein [Pseudomonadota bacterium]